LTAHACIIGNPSTGQSARPRVVDDVSRVAGFLQKRRVSIVNHDRQVGLDSSGMAAAFDSLVAASRDTRSVSLFYYCGHALECRDPKDILLLGQDAEHDDANLRRRSLSLLGCLEKWSKVGGLKVLVLDSCRLPDDGHAQAGLWEAFEDVHADLLRSIPDLFIITATGSGKAAYQGQFTAPLIERVEKLGRDVDELEMPLEGWLRNALGDIARKKKGVQRPNLFYYNRTQEWNLGDLVGRSVMTLEEATKQLEAAIEEVRKGNNGIQFIMTAVCAPNWQPPRSTVFLAEDHSTPTPTNLAPAGASEKIRAVADQEGLAAYNAMRKGTHEDAGAASCPVIPDPFGKLLLWRWRCEPNRSFIFLAGGVGPAQKSEQFLQYSEAELHAKDGKLSRALSDYINARMAENG